MYALLRILEGKLYSASLCLSVWKEGSFTLRWAEIRFAVTNVPCFKQIFTKIFFERNAASINRNDNILY